MGVVEGVGGWCGGNTWYYSAYYFIIQKIKKSE